MPYTHLDADADRAPPADLVVAAMEELEDGAVALLHHDAAAGRLEVGAQQLHHAAVVLERRMHEQLGLDGAERRLARVVQRLDGDGAAAVHAGVHGAHRALRELARDVQLVERDQPPRESLRAAELRALRVLEEVGDADGRRDGAVAGRRRWRLVLKVVLVLFHRALTSDAAFSQSGTAATPTRRGDTRAEVLLLRWRARLSWSCVWSCARRARARRACGAPPASRNAAPTHARAPRPLSLTHARRNACARSEFFAKNYASLKAANAKLPILLRESSGSAAKVTASYEFGIEKSVDVEGLAAADVGSQVSSLMKGGS